jgi:hypothetical protein
MMTTKLYILSRKIHRILVMIISVIGILMAITGVILKYPFISKNLSFLDLGLIRYLHNNLSPYFTIVFLLMSITGIFMYLFPLLKKSN